MLLWARPSTISRARHWMPRAFSHSANLPRVWQAAPTPIDFQFTPCSSCYSARHALIYSSFPWTRGRTSGHAIHVLTSFRLKSRQATVRMFLCNLLGSLLPYASSSSIHPSVHSCSQMTSRERLKRKTVDDVLGGEETWRDADSTSGEISVILCALCSSLALCFKRIGCYGF